MEIQNLSFLLGALLLLIALFGTGLEVKEFRIAKASTGARIVSSVLGLLFIGLGLVLSLLEKPDVVEQMFEKSKSETPSLTAEAPAPPAADKTTSPAVVPVPPSTTQAPPAATKPAPAATPATVAPMPVPAAAKAKPLPAAKTKPPPETAATPRTTAPPIPATKPAIVDQPDEDLVDNGFELPGKLGNWNIKEKYEGRRGVDGYQKVYHDLSQGAGGSGGSLAMQFRLGTERTGKHWNADIRARIKNDENRDLHLYRGVRFKIRSDSAMKLQFSVVDKAPDAYDKEIWRKGIQASTAWQDVTVRFNEMQVSDNWKENGKLDLDHVISLIWSVNENLMPPGQAGTLWLDDVRFFK